MENLQSPGVQGMAWSMVILANLAIMLHHSSHLESIPVTREVAGIFRSKKEVIDGRRCQIHK